jgi:hypothetical protein
MDLVLVSAPTRLRDLAAPPNVNDTLRSVLAEGDALDDLSSPDDAPGRWSIEVRCLVIYP